MKAVGEVDLVDGAIGARPSIGEGVGDSGDREDSAALCDQPLFAKRGSGVKHGDPFDLLRRLDLADQAAARRRPRIAARCNDDGDGMLAAQFRRIDFRERSGRDGVQQLRKIAVDQWHDRFALRVSEADVIFDELGPFGGEH